MDYETEMLDAHDNAHAMRFLNNSIRQIQPPELLSGGVPTMTSEEKAEQLEKLGTGVFEGTKRTVGSAATSLGQVAANIGSDLLQDTANQMIAPTLQTTDGADIQLKAPIYSVPQIETQNDFEAIMSDILQFGMGMAIAPGGFYAKGFQSAAFAFDPVEADLAGALNELGVLPNALEVLTSTPEEMATAEGRMRQRLKNGLQELAAAGAIDGIIRVVKNVKNTPEVLDRFTTAIQKKFVAAGQAADQRIAERATDTSVTLGSGVDPTPAIDASLSYLGKLLNKEVPIRSQGGLPIDAEKSANELRLHKMRIEKASADGSEYPGLPLNERTVINPPASSNLPPVVVGKVTPEDWVARIDATMDDEQVFKAANWYKDVFGQFKERAGGDPDEMAKLVDAWFAGQQQRSPEATLEVVLDIYEQIQRGVSKEELVGRGLPSASRIMIDILTGSEITGGAGQKITDFLDSGYDKNVRSFMNNDPAGGSPFVIDIHSARDTGLVDPVLINALTKLGYDVPQNLKLDFGEGGIKGTKYENRALFGMELTKYLNDIKWRGKNDWESTEIQAIGWNNMSTLTGEATGAGAGGDVRSAFAQNTRRISMEVDPGAGSPWAVKYGDRYSNLDDADKIEINNQVTASAIETVNKELGIKLGDNVHGTGGWELFQNPSTVQQAISSKDVAIRAAARLGYLLNQTEVWVNAPKTITANPKNFGVDIIAEGNNDLRDSERLKELFNAITEAEPNGLFRGYQPIIIDKKTGIKIIIDYDAIKDSPLTVKQAQDYILNFANNELSDITDRLGFNAQVDIMETDLTKLRNDWTEDQSGGGYKSYFGGQARKDAESGVGVLDNDRGELENLFSKLIDEAETRKTTSQANEPPGLAEQ